MALGTNLKPQRGQANRGCTSAPQHHLRPQERMKVPSSSLGVPHSQPVNSRIPGRLWRNVNNDGYNIYFRGLINVVIDEVFANAEVLPYAPVRQIWLLKHSVTPKIQRQRLVLRSLGSVLITKGSALLLHVARPFILLHKIQLYGSNCY